jgi:hypothetical protein
MGITKLLKTLVQIPPKVICAIKFIKNFYFCAFFYVLKIFGYWLYLPFFIIILIFKLKKFERQFWNTIKLVDNLFASVFFGLHFASFPESIMNACFRCKKQRNKKESLEGLGKKLEKIFANKDSFNFAFVLLICFALLFFGSILPYIGNMFMFKSTSGNTSENTSENTSGNTSENTSENIT